MRVYTCICLQSEIANQVDMLKTENQLLRLVSKSCVHVFCISNVRIRTYMNVHHLTLSCTIIHAYNAHAVIYIGGCLTPTQLVV